ncbi:MAG TPA: M17 family peptidase N-terminal domain-containing protein, partial [Pedococcus sp.]
MTTLTISDRPAHELKADALVLATVAADGSAALAAGHGLPREAADHLGSALTALAAKGSADEVLRLAGVPGVTAAVVVLTGLGEGTAETSAFPAETLRRAAGAATRALSGVAKVAVALPAADAESAAAVAEGAALGSYRYAGVRGEKAGTTKGSRAGRTARTKAEQDAGPTALTVVTERARDRGVKAAVKRAGVLAEATAYARDLVNTPPNRLFPQSFADSV